MAKQKITGLSASLLGQSSDPPPTSLERGQPEPSSAKPIVQTVKVPPDVYVRLKTIGARERRSNQDIILAALQEYLQRFPNAV
jgi:hypothetical protein